MEDKVQIDEKAEHTRQVVSILRKPATQPSGLRRGFETASREKGCMFDLVQWIL